MHSHEAGGCVAFLQFNWTASMSADLPSGKVPTRRVWRRFPCRGTRLRCLCGCAANTREDISQSASVSAYPSCTTLPVFSSRMDSRLTAVDSGCLR